MRLARSLRWTHNPARPMVLYAEPTLFCNLGCPSCPTGLKLDVRPRVAMDFEWYKKVLDELGPYLFYLNLYNWGEPLLHKQFPEMVAYAKQWNIRVYASSNLSLKLDRSYLERLVKSGLDKLKIGLEGTTQDVYEKYRVRGDLALTRQNMVTIQEIKRELGVKTPELNVAFHVFEHNQHQIDDARLTHKEWGADRISFPPSFISEQAEQKGIHSSTINQYNLYRPEGVGESRPAPCSWLWGAMVANPSGSISPCCGVVEQRSDFTQDARGRSLMSSVWNNALYRRARKGALEHPGGGVVHLQRDGMQLNSLSLGKDQLICERCPIPQRQDYVDRLIESLTQGVQKARRHKNRRVRWRAHLAYVLMGMPAGERADARHAKPTEKALEASHG
jgi:MoaA/NifB/PqqE/SkfB family radical SAM enzyme